MWGHQELQFLWVSVQTATTLMPLPSNALTCFINETNGLTTNITELVCSIYQRSTEVKYNKEISRIQLEGTQKYRSQTEIE